MRFRFGQRSSCDLPHPAAGEAQQQRHEDDDEDEVELGEHRAVADIRAVAILAIDEARDGVGRAARAARRDVDDDVGELQLEDDAQDDRR